jgi:hypothetical protein
MKISQQTNWPPEALARAMGDPDWAACAVRNVVCGVSGLSKDWPRPVTVWEAGRKVLSWEIVEGLRAGKEDVAARNLQTLVLASISLRAEQTAIIPK